MWSPFFYYLCVKKCNNLYRRFLKSGIILLCWGFAFNVSEAQTHCFRGRLVDDSTGLPVWGAHVWEAIDALGVVSDSTGYFQLCIPNGRDEMVLTISHASFNTRKLVVEDIDVEEKTIRLERKDLLKEEVQVVGSKRTVLNSVLPGQGKISRLDMERLPGFMGEPDIVRTLQQMPGVQSVSEGIGGVYVRGGGPGQNRVLLDNMELMNPVHLMGLFSIFNPLVVSDADIFKGHNPAFLRGGLSSSILVTSRNPLGEAEFLSGSVGNIATNLALSQRSKNGKLGLVTGFRRSHLELYREMTGMVVNQEDNYFEKSFYRFYDFNGKMLYRPNEKNAFALSWYLGNDDFTIDDAGVGYDAGSNYGNRAIALEWRHRRGDHWLFSSVVSYTGTWSDFDGEIINNDLTFRSTYDKYAVGFSATGEWAKHVFRTGMDATWYQTMPQELEMELQDEISTASDEFRNADVSVFVEDTWKVSPRVKFNAGVRAYSYFYLGPYRYENNGILTEAGSNEVVDNHFFIVPSLSFFYNSEKGGEYRFAWSRNVQMLHLAALSTMPLPNDIWMMSSPQLPPQEGNLWSFEYSKFFPGYEVASGVFARTLKNQLVFNVNREGGDMYFEDHFYHGEGRAFGVEVSGSKTRGRLQGSLNYTLSRSERSFPEIFEGAWFPDKFDRTHDLTLLASFKLNTRWTLNSSWIYATGNNMTLPSGRMWMMEGIMNDYDGYNNFRLPPYHRLDVSASLRLSSELFQESVVDFSITNVYNRANPYFVFFRVFQGESNYDITINAAQVSLFPVMPSISWRFKF